MLVLSRKKGEAIMLGDDIELVVLGIEGDQVRVGINAPKQLQVFRKELYQLIQNSNQEASRTTLSPSQLSGWMKKTKK